MNKEFRLPDVGEGLTEADIVSWHVKPGDTVTINQVIVEIETAKAVVELPSPYAGTVSRAAGDRGSDRRRGHPDHHDRRAGRGRGPGRRRRPGRGGGQGRGRAAAASRAARRQRPPRPLASRSSSGTASSRARPAAGRARARRPGPAPTRPRPRRRPTAVPHPCLPRALAEPPPNPRARPRLLRADPRGLGGQAPPQSGGPGGSSPGSDTEHGRLGQAAGATARPGPRHRPHRANRQRAGRVGHQGGCAEGGRRSNGPFDTSVFCGANRRPAPRRRAQPGRIRGR